jgi:predicted transcriptional regulator
MFQSVQPLILTTTRLEIIAHLLRNGGNATFMQVVAGTGSNPGLVSKHATRMAKAGVIRIEKPSKKKTVFTLTLEGAQMFTKLATLMTEPTSPSLMKMEMVG